MTRANLFGAAAALAVLGSSFAAGAFVEIRTDGPFWEPNQRRLVGMHFTQPGISCRYYDGPPAEDAFFRPYGGKGTALTNTAVSTRTAVCPLTVLTSLSMAVREQTRSTQQMTTLAFGLSALAQVDAFGMDTSFDWRRECTVNRRSGAEWGWLGMNVSAVAWSRELPNAAFSIVCGVPPKGIINEIHASVSFIDNE